MALTFKPGIGRNPSRRSFVLAGTDGKIVVTFLIPYEDVAKYHRVPAGVDPEPFLDRARAQACAQRMYRSLGPRNSAEMLLDYTAS